MVLLKQSAKLTPQDVFLEYLSRVLLVIKLVKFSITNSDPSSLSITFGLYFDESIMFSKEFYDLSFFIFQGNLANEFTNFINNK